MPDDTSSIISGMQSERGAIPGPRQSKPVKRRPLPADPTATTSRNTPSPAAWHGPRPLPGISPQPSLPVSASHTPESNVSRRGLESSSDLTIANSYAGSVVEEPQLRGGIAQHTVQQQNSQGYSPERQYNGDYEPQSDLLYENDLYQANHQSIDQAHHSPSPYNGLELPELPPHTPRMNRSSAAPTPKYYTPVNSSPTYTLPQYEPSPDVGLPGSSGRDRPAYNGRSPAKSDHYQSSPLRSQSLNDYAERESHPDNLQRHHSAQETLHYHDDGFYDTPEDSPPPPPPPHVRSGSAIYREAPTRHQELTPAPLNIRPQLTSAGGSPLAREYTGEPADPYSVSPTDSRLSAVSAPVTANHTPRLQQQGYESERRRSGNQEPFSPHDIYSPSQSMRPHSYATHPPPQSSPYDYDRRNPDDFRRNHHVSNQFGPGYETNTVYGQRSSQAPQQVTPPNAYDVHSRQTWSGHPDAQRMHRGSVPLIKPRAVSPDPRTPMRKSVSPHPDSGTRESGSRGGFFSPDSFDELNPNLNSAKSINVPNPKYNTPESIREAARAREKEEKLEAGPIIDSAGRVVDPSDHLPSDTWAPEPERKQPRKSHQINLKFRHSPQGAQPLPSRAVPPSREPTMRPQSMVQPPPQPMVSTAHSYSTDDVSPQMGGRNRLQKRPPVSFHSSPVIPTNQNRTPSQPLQEHPNYGYSNGPSFGHRDMVGPPPVPAKIPYGAEQEDWRTDSLSQEMSRIDIGLGPGARARRAQGRHGY